MAGHSFEILSWLVPIAAILVGCPGEGCRDEPLERRDVWSGTRDVRDVDGPGGADSTEPGDADDVGVEASDILKVDSSERADTGRLEETGTDASVGLTCRGIGPERASAECPIQEPSSFGNCDEQIGAVFDGNGCVPVTGCPCDGPDCPAFESVDTCAERCGDAGRCHEERFPLRGNINNPCEHWPCTDGVGVCIAAESNPEERLKSLMPEVFLPNCTRDSGVCEYVWRSDASCDGDEWCCNFRTTLKDDEKLVRDFCRLSLLKGVGSGGCYGLE